MLTAPDFNKKQIIFVFANNGEKLSFGNDNLIIKNSDGHIKFQITCYRLFIVYILGHCSLTTVLLQKANKFGFFFVLMTAGFRPYSVIGAEKSGNTLLKKKQYEYSGLEIAKHITKNKAENQLKLLSDVRNKSDAVKEAIDKIKVIISKVNTAETLNELMAYEGIISKLYFKNHFNNILWNGRQPRLKKDVVNSVLDIGYTLLFGLIDTITECFGFDTYCGVMHTQFYLRKSLICDLVEPFRPIVDRQIKKSINLKQIKDDDFLLINGQYRLKWDKSTEYVGFLMQPIIENKDEIFMYIQSYYRSFMKNDKSNNYPVYNIGR